MMHSFRSGRMRWRGSCFGPIEFRGKPARGLVTELIAIL